MHTKGRLVPTTSRLWLLAFGAILWLAPVESQARPPRARERQCVIQTIEHDARTMTLRCGKDAKPLELVWTRQTKFLKDWRFADVAPLKQGHSVVVYYRTPFFGKKFATRVVLQNG